ncbi:MAG: hypothetical protein HY827_08045 [Actinobacteria bacterium]|nr:hypothetical protein [Actinomycetota bacterium]
MAFAIMTLLVIGGAAAVLAFGGSGDNGEDAGRAAGEQLLRDQQKLAETRRRTHALERKKRKLQRQVNAQKRSRAHGGSSSSGGGSSAGFSALAKSLGGSVGLAYGPPGVGRDQTMLGDWSSGPAWSSIKVPISIAAVRDNGGKPSASTSGLMRRAITASDNAAAASLWSSLGGGSTAGSKIEKVLADAGNTSTSVQTQKVRSDFSPYGQTEWSVSDQQVFAAALPCLRGSDPVITLMGQVVSDQRWGLGQVGSNQRFKGGWGPDTGGAYDVRQFGLIDLPSGGTLAVAIAAHPPDGSFETGKSMLNQLAQWVVKHGEGGRASC